MYLGLQRGEIACGNQVFLSGPGSVVILAAPVELQVAEADTAAAARTAPAQGIVFQKTEALDEQGKQRGVLFAEYVHDEADMKARARRNALGK